MTDDAAPSPTSSLDETVHQRHRLGILTIAGEADRVDFGYLQRTLDLTPGNLNRHLNVLEEAGLVAITKEFRGRRPKTWVGLTKSGARALADEMAILDDLVRRHASLDRPSPRRRPALDPRVQQAR